MEHWFSNKKSITFNNSLALFHCGHEQCRPSHSFGPAVRPHYLFHYILGGKGKYHVKGETYELCGGQGFLITPGVSTLYEADENDPWEYCWIGFDGTDAEAILQTCGFTPSNPIYNDDSHGRLKNVLMLLVKAFDEGNANEYTYLGYLYLCLSYMRSDSLSKDSNIRPYLKQAMDYIQNNYTYDIKVSDIARFVGIDRTYLYKLFIDELMTSPQQYLIGHRLHMAKNLLKKTDLSVTEIACSCGFKDAPAFYKHFKKRLGITPLKYRSDKDFFVS